MEEPATGYGPCADLQWSVTRVADVDVGIVTSWGQTSEGLG
jgi:hypothetical protein